MVFAIALLTLSCSAPQAPPHPLVGSWQITYPWHLDVENGVVKPVLETGRLTVELRGDSLIATLLTDPSPQFSHRRPLRLTSPLGGTAPVGFVMRDPVTLSTGGTQRTVTAVTTWIFDPNGDRLGGTVERRLEGVDHPGYGPQPLKGSRVGS